jgi:hypothetical protein
MMILFVFHLPELLSVSMLYTVDWNLCFFAPELYQFVEFRRTTHVHTASVTSNLHPSLMTREIAVNLFHPVSFFHDFVACAHSVAVCYSQSLEILPDISVLRNLSLD